MGPVGCTIMYGALFRIYTGILVVGCLVGFTVHCAVHVYSTGIIVVGCLVESTVHCTVLR